MIIDAHCHVFPEELLASAACRSDKVFSDLYGTDPLSRTARVEQLIEDMKSRGISRAVISGFPWQDMGMIREHNEYLLSCRRRFGEMVIPFAALPPSLGPDAEREAQRCLEMGMGGAGEVAFYGQGFGTAQRKGLEGIMELLRAAASPLLLHVNEQVGHSYPGKAPFSFAELYRLIELCQGVSLILAHWGGGFLFYELMPEVKKLCSSVYYDTAASPYLYSPRIFRVAPQIVEPERILLGTDYPLLTLEKYLTHIERAEVDEGLREMILGKNAAALFSKRPS